MRYRVWRGPKLAVCIRIARTLFPSRGERTVLAQGRQRPRHWFGLRLSRGLRRGTLRHRLARRGGSRSWQRRWYPGPQVLLGRLGDRAGHLFLACLKLLGELRIVADHLCLSRLKLLGELRIVADHLCLSRLKLL